MLPCLPLSSLAVDRPPELEGVGITEHLGSSVRLDELHFVNELSEPVTLGKYFRNDKPVVLLMIYFRCPSLCNMVLNGLLDALRTFEWSIGKEFDLVAVSINPEETPELATEKKANYLKLYNSTGNRPEAEKGWHFLTGQEDQIRSLASDLGFDYKYLEKEKEYAHAAAIFVLTPEGKISRYLYGVKFKTNDLRFSLMDASKNRIGTTLDQVLLFCFHFDPSKNSYTLRMWRVVQLVLFLQVTVGGALLYGLWRSDRKKQAQKLQDQKDSETKS